MTKDEKDQQIVSIETKLTKIQAHVVRMVSLFKQSKFFLSVA